MPEILGIAISKEIPGVIQAFELLTQKKTAQKRKKSREKNSSS